MFLKKYSTPPLAAALAILLFFSGPVKVIARQVEDAYLAENIKTEITGEKTGHILIKWTMPAGYKGEFVLGRLETPIETTADILMCRLMGIFNPAQAGTYTDTTALPGHSYYYVVLTKRSLSHDIITLKKGGNVTAYAATVSVPAETVKSIRVSAGRRDIDLEWKKNQNAHTYGIYRSTSPISRIEELKASTRIGTTEENAFSDKNVSRYRTYFYAVTIIDKSGKEYYRPVMDENYTSNGTFIKSGSSSTPLNISAYRNENRSVIIKWTKPEIKSDNELAGFEIYRGSSEINSNLRLKESMLVKVTGPEETIYFDRNITPGEWYYAVFPRFKDGSSDINFTEKNSYTHTPAVIGRPYEITRIYTEKKDNRIYLKWDYSGDFGKETFQIVGSLENEPYASSVVNSRIMWINIKTKESDISLLKPSYRYIALIPENPRTGQRLKSGIDITENTADNLPRANDLKITGKRSTIMKKFQDGTSDTNLSTSKETYSFESANLNRIIRETFYKNRYRSAISELNKFMKKDASETEKQKALLFIGKSYIELGQYKKAVKVLKVKNFDNFYRDEAKFWFNFAMLRLN